MTVDIKALRAKAGVPGRRGRPSANEVAELMRIINAKSTETPAERITKISERFSVMYKLAVTAIEGSTRGLVISGAPGVGKSHTIKALLYQAKERNKINFTYVHGKMTPISLYKLLYKFKGENDVILLDDTDSVYEDEDSMNLLKAALDTGDTRKISWLSETAALGDIEPEFEYKGSMIFITNKDLQGEALLDRKGAAVHYRAIMDRAVYLDLKLHSREDVVAWISHMTRKHGILIQKGLTKGQQEEVVAWVEKHYTQIPAVSLRLLGKIAGYVLTFPTEWEMMARVTAFADDPRL
jgi:hypothetical protein